MGLLSFSPAVAAWMRRVLRVAFVSGSTLLVWPAEVHGTAVRRIDVMPGAITTSTTWRAGATYFLTGVVRVERGAVLTIEPGVRVEGSANSALVVDRAGQISALGTLLQPIIFGCPSASLQTRDCWGGLLIAGNAPVNGGTPDSPPARGVGASGCAQRSDDLVAGPYGGCDVNDNSGVLRYVRVEFGVRGLELLGVGRGTSIEFVQVHGGGLGGVTVRGGTIDLRHLIVTSSGASGLRWSGGWVGRAQHIVVQAPAEGGVGIDGSNDAATPTAEPRSQPLLYNVSLLRQSSSGVGASTKGLRLSSGTGAQFRNLLIAGYDVALDVDGIAGCVIAGSSPPILVQHSIVAGIGALGDPDADDSSCPSGALIEDVLLADPTIERITDAALMNGLLKDAFSASLPDFRTRSALFDSRATTPPADGFFLPSAYVGATEGATIRESAVSWTSGWTRHLVSEPVALLGSIEGVVASPTRGTLNGTRVEASGMSTLTSATGAYTLAGVPAGLTSVVVTTAPSGCTLPSSTTATVATGGTATANVTVSCAAPTITPSTLRLTYICGRRFRVRNPNDAVVTVTWDVFGTTEIGSLQLSARPLQGSFSETFFETVAVGTVRLFYQGNQVDVKANGGFACVP